VPDKYRNREDMRNQVPANASDANTVIVQEHSTAGVS